MKSGAWRQIMKNIGGANAKRNSIAAITVIRLFKCATSLARTVRRSGAPDIQIPIVRRGYLMPSKYVRAAVWIKGSRSSLTTAGEELGNPQLPSSPYTLLYAPKADRGLCLREHNCSGDAF